MSRADMAVGNAFERDRRMVLAFVGFLVEVGAT